MLVCKTLKEEESVGKRVIVASYKELEQLPRDDLKLLVHPSFHVSSGHSIWHGNELRHLLARATATKTLTTPPSFEFSLSILFTLDFRAIFLLFISNSSF